MEVEKLNLQDRCLRLEGEVVEKEERLHLKEEELRKKEELTAVATHWTETWPKVALTLQSTQEQLQELKKNNSSNDVRH